jgi:ATP/maltotriose-dependent transcriptional regulator MalT/DNA-binding SARP family transcriptional activator
MCAVTVEPQILRTKLYPPRLPEIVSRERLLGELYEARTAKLTAIVAGAGYGKSSLVAEFLYKLGRPYVWYHLEDTDSDLSEFLSYLVAGLRNIYEGFGCKTSAHMASVTNVSEQSRAVLSTFITELDELIGEELFIVLDDFHTVNESPMIAEALDFLLGHMLPNLHFFILSRSRLNLPLSRLRACRELLELREADLCFNREETGRLFSDVFNMRLDEEDVHALAESTEGWITGLVLFYLMLKAKAGESVSTAIRESGASLTEALDYLSKSIFESQPEAVRNFITRTSLLSRMNPGLCNELLGIEDAGMLLSYMVMERLFTIPLDEHGEWFRYHNMLKAFLQDKLHEDLSQAEIAELHLRAAGLWEKSGEREQALFHYMEAQSYEEAASVFEEIMHELMLANRVSFLYRELFRLPEDVLKMHPMLMLNGAQIAARFGDYDRVVDAALSAAEGFKESGEREEQALSLLRLAGAFFSVGRPDETREMLLRAREMISPDSEYMSELCAVEGTVLVTTGHDHEADRCIEESLALAAGQQGTELGSRALGFGGMALFLQGRLRRAVEVLGNADKFIERTGLTATHPFTFALLSRAYAYLDRLEEAKETAERGVALGEEHGLPPMVFFNRASRAAAWACLGERERALEDAVICASMCRQYIDIAQVAFAEWFIGEVYGLLGEHTEALKHFKRGERMVARYGDSHYIASLHMIAASAMELGLEKAAGKIQGILEAVRESQTGMARSHAYSMLFSLHLAAGRSDDAVRVLDDYIDDFGDDIILRSYLTDVDLLLEFFSSLFSQGKYLGFAERVFSIAGAKSIPCLRRLERSDDAGARSVATTFLESMARDAVEPLVIKLLGPLEAKIGGQALTAAAWKSKKACTAFKYLAVNRQKGFMPRDILMEMLWPESPVEAAQKSLNAALTTVRKTLEPGAGRGESSYLIVKGDSLCLELGSGGWIDLETFREKLSQAAKARERGDFDLFFSCLQEAADIYRGDFCAEDLYEEWCQSEREALKKEYIDLLKELATEHWRRGEGGEAMARLNEAIAKDPGREDLFRKLMAICSQAGNRAGIEEAYRRCCSYLRENYEVPPSPQTTELYQRLRQQ